MIHFVIIFYSHHFIVHGVNVFAHFVNSFRVQRESDEPFLPYCFGIHFFLHPNEREKIVKTNRIISSKCNTSKLPISVRAVIIVMFNNAAGHFTQCDTVIFRITKYLNVNSSLDNRNWRRRRQLYAVDVNDND